MRAWIRAHAAEAASKDAFALQQHCKKRGWHVVFLEGETGATRTGIIDAIAFRLRSKDADRLDLRLVQLKGGSAGISGKEIARLKAAALGARVNWLIAEFDGDALQFLPDDPISGPD